MIFAWPAFCWFDQYPDLKRHLYGDDGRLRAFVNVYVNDQDIRYLEKDKTPLTDGDNISIIPSIAGGCSFQRCHLGS